MARYSTARWEKPEFWSLLLCAEHSKKHVQMSFPSLLPKEIHRNGIGHCNVSGPSYQQEEDMKGRM